MKRVHYYIIGFVALLLLVVGGTWIGAYNGMVKRENDVVLKKGAVHASYVGRYDKASAMIGAIESANAQINSQIEAITTARSAFSNVETGTVTEIQGAADAVETTISAFVVLLEDNPSAWNTVGLYAQYMAEFNASTNSVTFSINAYNTAVSAFNTHIKLFPNVIFLGGQEAYTNWELPTLSTMPTF